MAAKLTCISFKWKPIPFNVMSQLIWAGRDFNHTDATTVLMATQVTETVAKATWTDSPYVCKADKQHAYGALV